MGKTATTLLLALLLAVAATVMILALPNADAPASATLVSRLVPIYQVQESEKKVALTIDAAWGADKTPEILDILSEYGVKATFFLVGRWVREYPENTQMIFEAGHEIGNHSDSHPHFSQLSEAGMLDELQSTEAALEQLGVPRPTLFRAPFGEYDDRVMQAIQSQGYAVIQWTVDTLDWQEGRTAEQVLDTVYEKICPGGIILCHNNAETITEYLPQLLEELQSQGYEFVTVSELIKEGWVTDNNGLLQPAS